MARGIHRFVVRLGENMVTVRAQSASLRGQAYTVGSIKVPVGTAGKLGQKSAASQAINSFFPKEV